MDRIKRFLAILVTTMMLVTSMPTFAFAEEGNGPTEPPEGQDQNPVEAFEPYTELLSGPTDEYTFQVKWNDNNDSESVRPNIDEYYNGTSDNTSAFIQISVRVGDEEAFVPLTKELAEQIGLSKYPEFYNVKGHNEDEWDADIALPKEYYNVSYVDLDGDGVLSQEEADKAIENAKASATSLEWNITYKNDGIPEHYYVESEKTQGKTISVEYTLMTKYFAHIRWQDNSNLYDSRPNQGEGLTPDDFDVYRYIKGSTEVEWLTDPENEGKYSVTITKSKEKANTYEITLENLPKYDPIGEPYEYYTVLRENDVTPVETDKDGSVTAIIGNDKGKYPVIYDNVDEYASDVYRLDKDGVLDLILENTTTFEVTKVWEGTQKRPENCMLYLYRLAEDKDGTINPEDLSNASPVQSFDSEKVPFAKESGIPEPGDTFEIKFDNHKEGAAYSDQLPMYDNDGHRYVYFAIEKGMSNDWVSEISHTGDAKEYSSDTVIKVVDTKNAENSRYVLNRGVITNRRTKINSQRPTKQFIGKAMQNMDAEVRMELQVKTEDGWVSYTDEEHENGVISIISGFSQEDTTVSGPSVEVNKYDSDGKEYEYRWVETGIKLSGQDDFIPVTYSEDKDNPDKIVYDEYNENVADGQNAPGIDGVGTTARFEPTQDSDSKVVNTLVGDTQVVIRKQWYDENGKNRVLDPTFMEGKEANFEVVRILDGNKEPVCDVTISLDAEGVEKVGGDTEDLSDDYLVYTITKENDSKEPDADPLARYDELGHEYIYDVVEKDNRGATYSSERSVVLDENGENYITQLETTVINGIGKGLVFDVDKRWLDDSDLETRKPVTVQLYEKVDGKLVAVDGATEILNEENNWFTKITIETTGNKTVDNYVVLETSVGGVEVASDLSDEEIIKRIVKKSPDGSNSEYDDNYIIGTVDEGDGECNDVHYKYDVFSSKGNQYGNTRAEYTVTNRRVAVLNLDLIKKWCAGGAAPDAEFTLYRRDAEGTEKELTTFVLGPDGIVDGQGYTDNLGNIHVEKPSLIGGFIDFVTKAFSNDATKQTEVTINDLPKYDKFGRMYTYRISENGMYDEKGKLHEKNDNGVISDIDGTSYSSKVSTTEVLAEHYNKELDKGHHSGDVYKWVFTNTRTAHDSITVNKVWRDDGTTRNIKARPDIRFNLYRVAVTDKDLEGFANEPGQKYTNQALAEYVNTSKDAKIVSEDKMWNTKHNDWYWSCKIENLPRYDEKGKKYVYFVKETYPGDPGDYYMMYSNENVVTDDDYMNKELYPQEGSEFAATEEVFALDADMMPKDCESDADKLSEKAGALIVSVGEDNDFSRTVVNARMGKRTVSGEKYWMLPDGWELPDAEKPVIEMKLYRTTEDLYSTMTASQIHNEIKNNPDRFELIKREDGEPDMREMSLKEGWSFKYKDLDKYNQYGTRYFYYPYEVTELSLYNPSITENQSNTTYSMVNTYNFGKEKVKVEVTKKWKGDVDPETHRVATFELWAQATTKDADGNSIDDDKIAPVKMSTKCVDVAHNKVIFEKCTDVAGHTGEELPLLGPNGNEFRYYVKEIVTPGYTSTDRDEDGKEVAKENNEGEGKLTITRDVTLMNYADVWTGSVEFDNEYTGGNTDITKSKSWEWNGYPVDEAYRPIGGVKFNVYRTWSEVAVNDNSTEPPATYTYEGGTEKVIPNVLLDSSNNWTYTKDELPKYAPSGAEYTYYIDDEQYVDKNGDPVDEDTLEKMNRFFKGERDGSNYKNTFRIVKFQVYKKWNNDETKTTLNKSDIEKLVALGLLPEKMYVNLWRKTEKVNEEGEKKYTAWEKLTDKTVERNTVDTADPNGNAQVIAAFDNLPKYDKDGNKYIYAAQEEIGGEKFPADADITTAALSGDKVSIAEGTEGFTPSVSEVSYEGDDSATHQIQRETFTNELDMTKVRVKKIWDDMDNFDDMRPENIKFLLKSTDETSTVKEVTLSPPAGYGNEWISDYIYYTMASTAEFDPSKYILVAEGDLPASYIKGNPTWTSEKDDKGNIIGWTATITNSNRQVRPSGRSYVSVEATKEWYGDKGVEDIARPKEIKFAIYYKEHNSDDWTFLSKEKALEIYNSDVKARPEEPDEKGVIVKAGIVKDCYDETSTYEPIKTANETNKWTVEWSEQFAKHWYIPNTPGTADKVQYKVLEVTVDAQGNPTPVADTDTFGYTVDNSKAEATPGQDATKYEATIKNTLKTTSVAVEKKWEGDYNDLNKLRPDEIRVTLTGKANNEEVTIPRGIEYVTLKAPTWTASYNNLPAYDKDGNLITYSVKEVDPGKHYEGADPVVTKKADGTFAVSVTNTLIPLDVNFGKALLVNEKCGKDPDGVDSLEGITFKIYYPDGTLRATATSDADGDVAFTVDKNGIYKIEEQDKEGSAVINDGKPYYFKIDGYAWDGEIYTDEDCTEVLPDNTVINDQIRGDIALIKTDEQIGIEEDGTVSTPLPGAEFGLYRKTADGDIEVATAITEEDGKISFEGLPTGYEYVIKELVAPKGYYLSRESIKFTFVNDNGTAKLEILDDGNGTIELQSDGTLVWFDPPVHVKVKKVDPKGKYVAGAELQLLDASGNLLAAWTTTGEEDVIDLTGQVTAGDKLTLHEEVAPDGYDLADDVEFVIPNEAVGPHTYKVIEVKMIDTKTPVIDTGDRAPLVPLIFTGLASTLALLVLLINRKKFVR